MIFSKHYFFLQKLKKMLMNFSENLNIFSNLNLFFSLKLIIPHFRNSVESKSHNIVLIKTFKCRMPSCQYHNCVKWSWQQSIDCARQNIFFTSLRWEYLSNYSNILFGNLIQVTAVRCRFASNVCCDDNWSSPIALMPLNGNHTLTNAGLNTR